MRNIRAWDDELKEMLHSTFEQFDDSLLIRFNKHFETENPIYLESTGLKDKNGKEIYELDFAEKDNCIYIVRWDKNKYILKEISNGDIMELDEHIKVRSNYYENAEKFVGEYAGI